MKHALFTSVTEEAVLHDWQISNISITSPTTTLPHAVMKHSTLSNIFMAAESRQAHVTIRETNGDRWVTKKIE